MPEIAGQIIALITDLKPYHDGIDAETNLLESGVLDSLALMVLVGELEAAFDIEIDAGDLVPENFMTVVNIRGLVEAKTNP